MIKQFENGTYLDFKLPARFYWTCCQCNLTHLFIIDKLPNGKIRLRGYLDDVMTKERRKKKLR